MRSMTGYGRCEREIDQFHVRIELKSVNHRYADFTIKTPRAYLYLEDGVREFLKQHICRGKVDVFLSIESVGEADRAITVNEAVAADYVGALQQLRDQYGLRDDISVATVARYSDVFRVAPVEQEQERIQAVIQTVLQELMTDYIQMSEQEGERLRVDLTDKLGQLADLAAQIEALVPQSVADYQQRLRDKIQELLGNTAMDEGRLLTEVALFADKTAIDEELVRLNSHRKAFAKALEEEGPVGKKLDFIVQEMNREINTIGSKGNNLEISRLVIEGKSLLEKIREQIQNLE